MALNGLHGGRATDLRAGSNACEMVISDIICRAMPLAFIVNPYTGITDNDSPYAKDTREWYVWV
jgi:hypothetical protein